MKHLNVLAWIAASLMLAACQAPSAKLEGGEAANLVLPIAGENQTWELKPLLGNKTVLLTFYATWCPYCNKSIPYVEEYYRKNKERGFEAVGIDLDEPVRKVMRFKNKYDLTFPVLLATKEQIQHAYPVKVLPTLFLIGKNGKLLKTFEGFHPSIFEEVEKAL